MKKKTWIIELSNDIISTLTGATAGTVGSVGSRWRCGITSDIRSAMKLPSVMILESAEKNKSGSETPYSTYVSSKYIEVVTTS